MKNNFDASFFVNNRRKLQSNLAETAPIILTANGQLQRGSDGAFAFQQDGSFWYLTGIEHPDVTVVLDGDDEFVIVPGRGVVREAFDGSIDRAALSHGSGIKKVYDEAEGWERLGKLLKTAQSYRALLPNPPYFDSFGIYANPARAALSEKIKLINPALEVVDIRADVARLRMVKQPVELKALQTAIDITIDSLLDATMPDKLSTYTHEYQLDADIARGFRYRGARGHGFDPIVAGGANATTLHNVANNSPLDAAELVVLDVGAEYFHYCADITRTVSLNGQPSERQQAVHSAVLDVQRYACSLLRPGVKLKEYEQAVEHYMGDKLIELGLITEASHENVREYYPHSTSHFLGIDPHDAGDYQLPLQPGVVITVEPGIYIPEEGIGVRIEDDVLVTANGIKILSERLPNSLTIT